MKVFLGTVKPSWSRLCVQVTALIPSPYHVTGVHMVRTAPLPPFSLAGIGGRIKTGPVAEVLSTLNICHTDRWQSDWFSLINTINFNISLLHLPTRKSKKTLI